MESWPVSEVASPPQGPLSPGDKASSYDNTKPQPEASPPGGNSKTQPSTVSHLLLTFKKYLLRSFYACLYQRSEGPELGGEIKGEKSKIEKLASTYLIWRETKKKKRRGFAVPGGKRRPVLQPQDWAGTVHSSHPLSACPCEATSNPLSSGLPACKVRRAIAAKRTPGAGVRG